MQPPEYTADEIGQKVAARLGPGVTATWASPVKARIVDPERGMWAGITASLMHPAVTVHAGWIKAGGGFHDPVAHSHRLDDGSRIELVQAVLINLWERVAEQPR